jgi:hypothetical protein
MSGVLTSLTTLFQAIATAFGSNFGVLIITCAIGGAAVAVLFFGHHMNLLWRVGIVGAVLLACGAIAQALQSGGG